MFRNLTVWVVLVVSKRWTGRIVRVRREPRPDLPDLPDSLSGTGPPGCDKSRGQGDTGTRQPLRKGRLVSRRGWLLFATMGLIWGMPYLLIKVADGGVSVPVLVCTRVAIGSALLLPLAIRGGQLRLLKGHIHWLAAFTLTEIVGPFALLTNAEKRLPSSTSGLLVAAVPIFGAIIAILLGSSERPTPVRWLGLVIGLSGVAVLAGPGAGRGSVVPVLEVLGTALGYSIGPMIASRKFADLPSVSVNAVCLGAAAVIYAPFAAATWPDHMPTFKVLASLAGLGVICTAAGFLVFFRLIAEVGPARATVITYVNPAVAVALGVLVLGEPLTAAIGVAFVLILGGSVLATRPGSSPARSRLRNEEPQLVSKKGIDA
jgi:drug/metabolite transporter (DMT)-like permease